MSISSTEIPSWPEFVLPAPRIDYSYAVTSKLLRNSMESGRVRQRKRFTGRRKLVKAIWTFKYQQLAAFESFVENNLNSGSSWFYAELPSPSDEGMVQQKILINNGQYEVTALAGERVWEVSAEIFMETFSVISETDLYILNFVGITNVGAFIDAYNYLRHEISHFEQGEHPWQ